MNVCENCEKSFNYNAYETGVCAYCMRDILTAHIEQLEYQALTSKYDKAVKEINGLLQGMGAISVVGFREETI